MSKVYNTQTNKSTTTINKDQDFDLGTSFEMEEELEEDQGQWITHLFTRNGNLSFACRGFLAYLFSHKSGFKINLKMIQNNVFNIPYKREKGRDYIRRLAKEAEDNGYLSKQYYILNGLRRFNYKVHKKPLIKNMFARDGYAGAGYPVPLLSISSLSTDKDDTESLSQKPKKPKPIKSEKEHTAPSSPIIPFWFFKDKSSNVGLTAEEYDSLVKELGLTVFEQAVSVLRDWDMNKRKSGGGFKSKNLAKKIRSTGIEIRQKAQEPLVKQVHDEAINNKVNSFLNNLDQNTKRFIGINRKKKVLLLETKDKLDIELSYTVMNDEFFEKLESWRKNL